MKKIVLGILTLLAGLSAYGMGQDKSEKNKIDKMVPFMSYACEFNDNPEEAQRYDEAYMRYAAYLKMQEVPQSNDETKILETQRSYNAANSSYEGQMRFRNLDNLLEQVSNRLPHATRAAEGWLHEREQFEKQLRRSEREVCILVSFVVVALAALVHQYVL